MKRKKVPLVLTEPPPDEFGELKEDARFHAEDAAAGDLSYVPGFSEMRRQRDREVLEASQGRRQANEVSTLDVNLRWGRCQNKQGEPDSRKIVAHSRRGYRAVTKDDVGQPWLRELPAGASISADGTIRQGDTQLLVTDAAHAARNAATKRQKTLRAMTGAKESLTGTVPGGFVEQADDDD